MTGAVGLPCSSSITAASATARRGRARREILHATFWDRLALTHAWPSDRRPATVPLLAAQPAEKGAHQQFGVEAIGLRASVFARHRDARGMDNVSLNTAHLQPARQPEAIASGFISVNRLG